MIPRPPGSTLFPYTTVFRSGRDGGDVAHLVGQVARHPVDAVGELLPRAAHALDPGLAAEPAFGADLARKGTRLNAEHQLLSYPAFFFAHKLDYLPAPLHPSL